MSDCGRNMGDLNQWCFQVPAYDSCIETDRYVCSCRGDVFSAFHSLDSPDHLAYLTAMLVLHTMLFYLSLHIGYCDSVEEGTLTRTHQK